MGGGSPSFQFLLLCYFENSIFFHPFIQQRARRCLFITIQDHVAPPLIVYRWTLGFKDHRLGTVQYALKVTVCAQARLVNS